MEGIITVTYLDPTKLMPDSHQPSTPQFRPRGDELQETGFAGNKNFSAEYMLIITISISLRFISI